MKIGFLFPGQGSQTVGMGKDLYDTYKEVRDIYNTVNDITGIDVANLTFESDEATLTQTKNTQIAILTMSLGILKVLESNNIKADVVSGLSLGEYTALIYSKIFNLRNGVKLVQKRGEFMQNLLPDGEWSMAAFLGADEDCVTKICSEVKSGFIVPVNFNCPGQIAVSGEKKAILEAIEISKNFDVKKVKELNTSGPFHTIKLVDAALALKEEMKLINFGKSNCDVVKNLDGNLYIENDDIKDVLYRHMISPVRFDKCIYRMLDLGVDTFIEIGPGKTLSSFVKRTNKDVNVFNINNVETLQSTLLSLKI